MLRELPSIPLKFEYNWHSPGQLTNNEIGGFGTLSGEDGTYVGQFLENWKIGSKNRGKLIAKKHGVFANCAKSGVFLYKIA